MPQHVLVELEMPTDLATFILPTGVNERLQELLDRQDQGQTLTSAERSEAEGLSESCRNSCRCYVSVRSGFGTKGLMPNEVYSRRGTTPCEPTRHRTL